MKKFLIIFIIVLILAIGAGFRIHDLVTTKAVDSVEKIQQKSGIPVRVFEAKRTDLENIVSVSGSIEPLQTVRICPVIAERIQTIHVNVGQKVAQGDLLVSLDATKSKLNLAAAQASRDLAQHRLTELLNGSRPEEIETARAAVAQAQAFFQLQQLELERFKKLYEEEATTLRQLQTAENQFNTAKAALDSAQAQFNLIKKGPRDENIAMARTQLESALVSVKQAERDLADHYLTSPFDGRTTVHLLEPGDIVDFNQPIFQVLQVDPVYLVLEVSELYIPNLKLKMPVNITVDVLPGEIFTGIVDQINPQANPATRGFTTKILIDNRDEKLKPGMFARARIVIDKIPNTLVVTTDAVRFEGSQAFVLVVDDSLTAQKRNITSGSAFDNFTQVIDGLNAGEKVITLSQDIVQDGAKVIIAPESALSNPDDN